MNKLMYQLYRYKYIYGKHLNLNKPVDIMLELSSKCNQVCTYCYHAKENKPNLPFSLGFMDLEHAKKIIRESAEIGVNSLKFNFRGEGTLHPNYTEITSYAKSLSKGMTFIDRIANTNMKIPKSVRDDIFEGLANLTKVKVSFDSFVKSVFETQRAGGNFDIALENIDLFYNHPSRIKSETQLVIQAVRTKLNKDEDIYHQVKKRWPEAKVSIRDMVEGRLDKDLGSISLDNRDFDNRQSCLQAHVRLVFTHDGLAQVCCPDIKSELIVGDIRKNTVYEIFNSKFAWNLRRMLKNKDAFKFNPCKGCSSYESFKGYCHPKQS